MRIVGAVIEAVNVTSAVGIEAPAVISAAVGAAAAIGCAILLALLALAALTLLAAFTLLLSLTLTLLSLTLTLLLTLTLTLLLALALATLLREALKLRAHGLNLGQSSLAIVPRGALLVPVLHGLLRRPQVVLHAVQRLRDRSLARRHLIPGSAANPSRCVLDTF